MTGRRPRDRRSPRTRSVLPATEQLARYRRRQGSAQSASLTATPGGSCGAIRCSSVAGADRHLRAHGDLPAAVRSGMPTRGSATCAELGKLPPPERRALVRLRHPGLRLLLRTSSTARAPRSPSGSHGHGVSSVIGVMLGAIAGYYGGLVDSLLSRLTDIFFAIPFILGAIVLLTRSPGCRSVWTGVLLALHRLRLDDADAADAIVGHRARRARTTSPRPARWVPRTGGSSPGTSCPTRSRPLVVYSTDDGRRRSSPPRPR